jgi:hypothetical protein
MKTKDAISRKRAATAKVTILLDPDLADRRAALVAALAAARHQEQREENGGLSLAEANKSDQIQADLDALDDDLRENSITYTFAAMPQEKWRALVQEYPPTAKEVKDARAEKLPPPSFNLHGLGPKLLAKACIEPGISEEEAAEIWAEWSDGETGELFRAAYSVQRAVKSVPFTVTSSRSTESSEKNSTTASPSGSPTRSSSDVA